MVEGRLKLDQWEDKTSGQKRSKIKVVLDNVQFLSSRGGSGGGGGGGAPMGDEGGDSPSPERHSPPSRGGGGAKPGPAAGNIDEDVPF
jgi:single-strand DNA-binding protein